MGKKITLAPKGFSAFAVAQGSPPPERGVNRGDDGKWYGWQREPQFMTSSYGTRVEAEEALLRDAPTR